MLVLVGGSASGKSTIEKELVKQYGYKNIISYTTRQPRVGEENGKDYHFVSDKEFNSLKLKGFFAECTTYNGWQYGASKDQCSDDTVFVVNPCGLRQIKKIKDLNIVSFYINVPRRDRLIKILQRGDDIDESIRRSIHDDGQFTGVEEECDYIVNNEGYELSVEELAQHIHTGYVAAGYKKWEDEDILETYKSQEAKPTLFLDFDGTIANSIKAIVDLYNEDFRYYPWFYEAKEMDINSWGFEELRGVDCDHVSNYFQQPRFFDILQFMPGAEQIIKELSERYDIKIVSFGHDSNLKLKELWIKNNMPYAEFIGVNFSDYEDKSHVDMSGGIFIDDRVDYLESSNAKIKIIFGKMYPWNIKFQYDNKTKFDCHDWEEVREVLENDRL